MERFSEKALVLSTLDYGEADRLVVLFTQGRGRLTAFAPSARKSRRRFAGALEPFMLLTARLCERRGDTFRLDGVDIEAGFYSVRASLPLIARALYCLELCRELTRDGEPHPGLFSLLVEYLEALDRKAAGPSSLISFELDALSQAGLRPRLGHCSICGRPSTSPPRLCSGPNGAPAVHPEPVEGELLLLFDPHHGGVVCERCTGRARHAVPVPAQVVEGLVGLQGGRREPLLPEVRQRARELLNLFIAHQLGRKLNSVEFMAQVGVD